MRGLTHPEPVSASLAYANDAAPPSGGGAAAPRAFSRAAWTARKQRQPWQRPPREEQAGSRAAASDPGFANFLVEWGAVPVGPSTLFKLLRNGEAVLLYPGGAAEACFSS